MASSRASNIRRARRPPASAPKPKVRHLTFLLLRRDIKKPEAALKTPGLLHRTPLPAGYEFEGILYVFAPPPKEPRWVAFVKEGFPDGISFSPSAAAAAVLFVKADSRWFAVTFGQGRHLLTSDSYEIDFGLRVTLNTVDEKKLRSLDSRTFDELTVHTRRQVSRSSALDAFSVDIAQDLLGAVTGEPSDSTLAKRLAGRDALALTGPITFLELATRCRALLTAYKGTQYQQKFPWVDNIRLVRDSKVLEALNDELLRALNAGDLQKIHLAPPEVIPWDDVAGFRYPGERDGSGEPHPDLDLTECLAVLAAREGLEVEDLDLSLDDLKRIKIRAVFEEHSSEVEKWTLYNCLVAELRSADALHVLSAGQWFRIEKNFATQTLQEAAALVKEFKGLPSATPHEDEGTYNEKAARTSSGLVLLDRKLIKSKGAQTAIEACDLFSSSGQFIHVKRKVRSSTLSHLFAQGTVATETFLRDEHFRKDLKELVEKQNPGAAKLLGNPAQKPDPTRYEIVFAVITDAPKEDWPQALPFFSQLNLVRNARRLSMFGFRVSLCRIGEAVP
ncbi:TIGR04141 family sporadically distributed protein [Archangium lansingense]|uniref:TIGR04141 family sporadically distributed protein n=1 Tax=Archangium lansingense TaxID=2995310 RepID=A0ABT3ZZI8_9BACT|nr:TIGR04141 family sporadically distributed protein [Archangium lansinium]MCY1074741.1 TIGR04141 family sporadically distributed protein [Archangium lansinium]